MQYTDKIEQYLDGEMTQQEAIAFEKQVKTNPDLAYEVKRHQFMIAGIQHEEEERFQEFEARMEAMKEKEKNTTSIFTLLLGYFNMRRSILAAAAIFLLLFAGNFLWTKTHPMASISMELIAFNESGTKGTASDAPKTTLQQAIQLFKNKEYKAAISLFDQTIRENPNKRAAAQFLKADALYRLGSKEDARIVLQSIQASDDERLYNAAQSILEEY